MKGPHSQKRCLIAGGLGIASGFLCAFLASGSMGPGFWWSATMWSIVTSRLVTGMVIGFAGVFKFHPLFGFKLNPVLRGAALGIITSIPLACGTMINPIEQTSPWSLFGATLLMGAIYGIVIDFFATKYGGEGKELLKN